MNTFCLDSQRERNDELHMLLFAAREAFHESLHCSPFELIFGHCVGSLFLKKWLSENTVMSGEIFPELLETQGDIH
jgi:hypothetical protein